MKRHSIRWESLAFGLFFLAIAVNWIADKHDVISLHQLGIAAPVALIVIGALGIVLTLLDRKDSSHEQDTHPEH